MALLSLASAVPGIGDAVGAAKITGGVLGAGAVGLKNLDKGADSISAAKRAGSLDAPKAGAASERAKNLERGIPESQLGPSGKPKIHTVDHSSRKKAKDAARQDGKRDPIRHPSDEGQPPHYHSVDSDGNKIGQQSPHHNYPPSKR